MSNHERIVITLQVRRRDGMIKKLGDYQVPRGTRLVDIIDEYGGGLHIGRLYAKVQTHSGGTYYQITLRGYSMEVGDPVFQDDQVEVAKIERLDLNDPWGSVTVKEHHLENTPETQKLEEWRIKTHGLRAVISKPSFTNGVREQIVRIRKTVRVTENATITLFFPAFEPRELFIDVMKRY